MFKSFAAQSKVCKRKKKLFSIMADQLCQIYWSETALSAVDIAITPEFVAEALRDYWENFANGLVGHEKIIVPLDRNLNGSREGALIGYFGMYSGLKNIHYARNNLLMGKPLQHIDIVLRNRFTRVLLMFLEGVAISNARTGWLAVACINLLLQGKNNIRVFLFGAGKIAQAVILALNCSAPGRIKHIAVLSRGKRSNHELVERLQPQFNFRLSAVDDRKLLRQAKFVITATDAGQPLFKSDELAPNAVTLPFGIDELPADYFDYLLKMQGVIVADDMEAMEARNVDPLTLYYSKRDLKLTKHGRKNGIRNYSEVLFNEELMKKLASSDHPANFCIVGLASYDLAVARHVFVTVAARV